MNVKKSGNRNWFHFVGEKQTTAREKHVKGFGFIDMLLMEGMGNKTNTLRIILLSKISGGINMLKCPTKL